MVSMNQLVFMNNKNQFRKLSNQYHHRRVSAPTTTSTEGGKSNKSIKLNISLSLSASYAGIAKLKSATGPVSNAPTSLPPPQPSNPVRPVAVKPTVPNRTNTPQQQQQLQQQPSQQRGNGNFYQQNTRGNQWNDNNQQDQSPARRSGANVSTAPNEQQVFVGSLPLEFTREDLIQCFQQFGTVLDAKIHQPNRDNKKVCFIIKKKPRTDILFFSIEFWFCYF